MSTDNQSAQSALLPCPFCGSNDLEPYYYGRSEDDEDFHVECNGCKATGPNRRYANWNTRSALAQAPAPSGEVPEGWVLVPKEATWEMQQAALDASRKLGPLVGLGRGEYVMPKPAELWCSAFIYKAMIAAAPKGASK